MMKRVCPIMSLSRGYGISYCIEEQCAWCRIISGYGEGDELHVCAILEIAHRLHEIAEPLA